MCYGLLVAIKTLLTVIHFSRSEYFPTSFKNSITYDLSIIVCMTKHAVMFMALNIEIENYYKNKGLSGDGILLRIRDEKKIYLENVKTAAIETYTWALDKRQDDIETGAVKVLFPKLLEF